jgi:hypothetical protein
MKKILLEGTEADTHFGPASKVAIAINTGCFNKLKNIQYVVDPISKRKALQADNPSTTSPLKFLYFFDDFTTEIRDTNTDKPTKTQKTTWNCELMNKATNPQFAEFPTQAVESLKSVYSGLKLATELSGQDFFTYQQVDLQKIANGDSTEAAKLGEQGKNLIDTIASNDYLKQPLMKSKTIVFLPKGGKVQKTMDYGSQFAKCLKDATAEGWMDIEGGKPTDTNASQLDLNTYSPGCKGVTQQPYYLYKTYAAGQVIQGLMDALKPVDPGIKDINQKEESEKNRCKNIITTYYTAAIQKEDIDQNRLNTIKPEVNKCIVKLPNFRMFGKNKLEKMVAALQSSGPVTTVNGLKVDFNPKNTGAKPMAENIDKKLKNIIRENLINASKNKKKGLLQESKIVKNRFNILAEGVNHKTKKGQRIIAKRLFTEMAYLNTQGFDKKIINEQIWDFFKSLFGNTFSFEPVFDYFKEYLVKSLLEKFGVDTSGWIANIVITTIGNIQLGDINKLTDCNFLSKILSKSIAEGAVRKLQGQSVGVGPLQDILRNALVDTLGETDLGEKIESFLGQLICPMISKIAGNMDSTMNSMKTNALGLSS